MSQEPPINLKKGLAQYGGDEDMFKLLIDRYEDLTFNSALERLYKSMKDMDFDNICLETRIIKGGASYLSAERCQQKAEKLETSAEEKKQNETVENYLNLMIESKALKMHIAKLTNRQPDITQIEKYEQDIAMKYPIVGAKYIQLKDGKVVGTSNSEIEVRVVKKYNAGNDSITDVGTGQEPAPPVCCGGCSIF